MLKVLGNKQRLICYGGLFLIFILLGHTNTQTTPFYEYFLRPIRHHRSIFHWGSLVLIIALYSALTILNKIHPMKVLKNTGYRIVSVFIVLSLFTGMWNAIIPFFKQFRTGINGIYVNRQETNISVTGDEKHFIVTGNMALKNCTKEQQSFWIEVKLPSYLSKRNQDELVKVSELITLEPHETQSVKIEEAFSNFISKEECEYRLSIYEFRLANHLEYMTFYGTEADYYFEIIE